MPILYRDYETHATLNLKKVGAWRYAAHPDTDVLCAAYCVDDGPVKLWIPGNQIPPEFIEAAQDSTWVVAAFNDNFERQIETHIMGPRYDWPTVPIERRRCLQASSLSLALPLKLEKVAKALDLEQQKDAAGGRIMRALSQPRKPRKDEDPNGVYWDEDPARLERLYNYCKQDIETERELLKRVGFLGPDEQTVWQLDQVINDRGVYLNAGLVAAVCNIDKSAQAEIDAKIQIITGGSVEHTTQVQKLQKWLQEHNCAVANLQIETINSALEQNKLSDETRQALELRRDGNHPAVKKFRAMRAVCSQDGRARGSYTYHGCSTGRWASHGVQFHNLKKEPPTGIEAETLDAVNTGSLDQLKSVYPDNPLDLVGKLARAAIVAAPGHRLLIADFSGIESRVLAWLSGQQSKLDTWAEFDRTSDPAQDPYLLLGQRLGFPENEARNKGKTADLAFGYMGGVGAFRKISPDDPASDSEIKQRQGGWRNAHPATVKFWGDINHTANMAVQSHGKTFVVNSRISFRCGDSFLKMRLPSGRDLAYPFPRLHTGERGDLAVVYKDMALGQWVDCRKGQGAYGGIWTENAVQAIARDVFADAMLRLEVAGYPVVAHTHDEIVVEVPERIGGLDEFRRILIATPERATGGAALPLAAKGRESRCYCKIAAPEDREPERDTILEQLEENLSQPDDNLSMEGDDTIWLENDDTVFNRDGYPNGEDYEEPKHGPTYTYLDEHGQPYLRVTRTITRDRKKIFPQEHWNGSQWISTKHPRGKIPYRLPELTAAPPSEPVFICEGEKDTESVARLGFIATTNSGGGGPKQWTSELNRWFTERKTVYICEDNDQTGRSHASEVASALKGIVAEIHIIEFRDMQEHGDVSDWLKQGHTKAELLDKARNGREPSREYALSRTDNIIAKETDYMWTGHLARGALELLTGLPAIGKSQIQCAYVACVTTGRAWPDGANGQGCQNVIMLTAEDNLAQTVVPRLIAAGADLTRVHILQSVRRDDKDSMFMLQEDLDKLAAAIAEVGSVGLVSIDPLTAYMGGKIDSHKATDVRSVLGPLKDFAERANVAFSAITHPAKNAGQRAMDHYVGSQAYIAAARLAHICVEEMHAGATTGRSLFLNPKNSLGSKMPGIAYRIEGADITPQDKMIKTSKIVWEEAVEINADEALAGASGRKERVSASSFLMDVLCNGPVPKKRIDERAKQHKLSDDQLRLAKEKAGIVTFKMGVGDGWAWALPQHVPEKAQS